MSLNSLRTPHDQALQLYELLKSKLNGFVELFNALQCDGQTGPARILDSLRSPGGNTNDTIRFATTRRSFDEFRVRSDLRILVVCSKHVDITKQRLLATDPYIESLDFQPERSFFILKDLPPDGVALSSRFTIRHVLESLAQLKHPPKFVLVTPNSRESVQQQIDSSPIDGRGIVIVEEKWRWDHLHEISKTSLLSRSIKFQGLTTTLQDLLREKQITLNGELINGSFLDNLILDNCPELIQYGVPKPCKRYYRRRTLIRRRRLDDDLFKVMSSTDVFVMSGIEFYQLAQLAGRSNKRDFAESTDQLKKLTAHFIELRHPDHYHDICKIASPHQSVHLIRHVNSKFFWEETHGSIQLIQKHVLPDYEVLDEDDCLQTWLQGEGSYCIDETPGMGKSWVLEKVANKIRETRRSHVVQFLEIQELIKLVNSKKKNVNLKSQAVANAIAKNASECGLGQKIVREAIISEKIECDVFIHGFDQVKREEEKLAEAILKELKSYRGTRLYVTTRPHKRTQLETLLGTLGHNIVPFDDNDQLNFLVGYWINAGATENRPLLEAFARSCIAALKKTGKTDKERDIAGIPMLCRLLAEKFKDDAIRISNDGQGVDRPSKDSETFLKLYSGFMEDGFGKYSNEKSKPVDPCSKMFQWLTTSPKSALKKSEVERVHIYYAFEVLFPQFAKNPAIFVPENERHSSDLFTAGIMELRGQDKGPKFVHHTFAEYLVAETVSKIITTPGTDISWALNFLLRFLLDVDEQPEALLGKRGLRGEPTVVTSYVFRHPCIAYFIDALFLQRLRPITTTKPITNPDLFFKLYTASVASDFYGISQFLKNIYNPLLTSKSDPFTSKSKSWVDITLLAAKHACKDLVEFTNLILMKLGISPRQLTYPICHIPHFEIRPLHVAVFRGEQYVVNYLINDGIFSYIPDDNSKHSRYLLHLCVSESGTDDQSTIDGKLQVISDLVVNNRKSLEEKIPADNSTAVLQPNINFQLVHKLINSKANINALTKSGSSLLQTVLETRTGKPSMSAEDYLRLLQLLKEKRFQHFNTPNLSKMRPFDSAMEALKNNITPEIVTEFMDAGPEMLFRAPQENPVLFTAVRNCESEVIIRMLLSVADPTQRNRVGKTILHAAAESANETAIQIFIRNDDPINSLLNAEDDNGNNPLHASVGGFSDKMERIQIALIFAGVSVTAVNGKRRNAFLHALIFGKGLRKTVIQCMENVHLATGRGDAPHLNLDQTMATKGLKGLLMNRQIMPSEWNSYQVETAMYLFRISGCGVIDDAWGLVQFEELKKAIHYTGEFREAVEKYIPAARELHSRRGSFLEDIKKIKGSFEPLMISTLFCQEIYPYLILRQALFSHHAGSATFITAPDGIINFHGNPATKHYYIFLHSQNFDITMVRLLETVDPNIARIPEEELDILEDKPGLSVVLWNGKGPRPSPPTNFIHHKIIYIVDNNRLESNDGVPELEDEASWKDLSTNFSITLRQFVSRDFEIRENLLVEQMKTLKSKDLVELIQAYRKHKNAVATVNRGGPPIIHQFAPRNCDRRNAISSTELFEDSSRLRLIQVPNSISRLRLLLDLKKRCDHPVIHSGTDDFFQNLSKFDGLKLNEQRDTFGLQDWQYIILQAFGDVANHLKRDVVLNLYLTPSREKLNNLVKFVDALRDTEGFDKVRLWIIGDFDLSQVERKLQIVGHEFINEPETQISSLIDEVDPENFDKLPEYFNEGPIFGGAHLQKCGVLHLPHFLHRPNINPSFLFDVITHLTSTFHRTSLPSLQELIMEYMITFFSSPTPSQMSAALGQFPGGINILQDTTDNFPELSDEVASFIVASLLVSPELSDFLHSHSEVERFLQKTALETEKNLLTQNSPRLRTFANPLLVHFINALLPENRQDNRAYFQHRLASLPVKVLSKLLPACVFSNFPNLLHVLVDTIEDKGHNVEIDDKIIGVAVLFSSVEILDYLCDLNKKLGISLEANRYSPIFEKINCASLLDLGVLRGNLQIVDYLLQRKVVLDKKTLSKLLKLCLENSVSDPPPILEGRRGILRQLLWDQSQAPEILSRVLHTPTFYKGRPRIHVDLLIELLALQAEPFGRDTSVLHLCAEDLTPSQHLEIIRCLSVKHSGCFQIVDGRRDTVLHAALRYSDVTPEALEILMKGGVKFKAMNDDRETVLHCAAERDSSTSIQVLDKLIEFGVKVEAKNRHEETALMVANRSGNHSVRQCLVSKQQSKEVANGVNKKDFSNC